MTPILIGWMNYMIYQTILTGRHTIEEIDAIASAHLPFERTNYGNPEKFRAWHAIWNWILCIGRQRVSSETKIDMLISFVRDLVHPTYVKEVEKILLTKGITADLSSIEDKLSKKIENPQTSTVDTPYFHSKIQEFVREEKGIYIKVLLRSIKYYEKECQNKAGTEIAGVPLFREFLLNPEDHTLQFSEGDETLNTSLKIGLGLFSRGLWTGIRHPLHHNDIRLSDEDCLCILGLISYLLKQLDKMEKFDIV